MSKERLSKLQKWILKECKISPRTATLYMLITNKANRPNGQHVAHLKEQEQLEGISFRGIMRELDIGIQKKTIKGLLPPPSKNQYKVIVVDLFWGIQLWI